MRMLPFRGFLSILMLALAAGPASRAATPPDGTLDDLGDVVMWEGGPYRVSNPLVCTPGEGNRVCDHFALTIESPGPDDFHVQVSITTADPENTDFDLYVYGPDGALAGSSFNEGTQGEVVTLANPAAGTYIVEVQPYFVPLRGARYDGTATMHSGSGDPVDTEQDCDEFVPAAAGVSGVTDDGDRVSLDVLVLLDGVDQDAAEALLYEANRSYEPLGIDLVVATYESVYFSGASAEDLIEQAKSHVGGSRPDGIDLVFTLTNEDIESGDDDSVVGLADCIGGVRYADRAFGVSEVTEALDDQDLLGIGLYVNEAAKTIAHEMGHLLGAHHHYANCVEGLLDDESTDEVTPCTVMWLSSPGSTNFGALEGSVVRGHTVDYASD